MGCARGKGRVSEGGDSGDDACFLHGHVRDKADEGRAHDAAAPRERAAAVAVAGLPLLGEAGAHRRVGDGHHERAVAVVPADVAHVAQLVYGVRQPPRCDWRVRARSRPRERVRTRLGKAGEWGEPRDHATCGARGVCVGEQMAGWAPRLRPVRPNPAVARAARSFHPRADQTRRPSPLHWRRDAYFSRELGPGRFPTAELAES